MLGLHGDLGCKVRDMRHESGEGRNADTSNAGYRRHLNSKDPSPQVGEGRDSYDGDNGNDV